MKQSILAIMLLTIFSTAMASGGAGNGNNSTTNFTGVSTITGSASSTVSGGTYAQSVISVAGTATHSAISSASETTTLTGFTTLNSMGATVGTTASAVGVTNTAGTGLGVGSSNAWANQSGYGTVSATTTVVGVGVTSGSSKSTSTVGSNDTLGFTFGGSSSVLIDGVGTASSNTNATAFNTAGATVLVATGLSNATGYSNSTLASNSVNAIVNSIGSSVYTVNAANGVGGTYSATVIGNTVKNSISTDTGY